MRKGFTRRFVKKVWNPIPFNPSTTIHYEISRPIHLTLKIYDGMGHDVAELVDHQQNAGNYQIFWHGTALLSGVYFGRMTAGDFKSARKLILMK